MQGIIRIAVFALLLSGCATSEMSEKGIGLVTTYVNYKSDVGVLIEDVVTDRGYRLGHGGYLHEGSTTLFGKTLGNTIPGTDLPEWIQLRWIELDPAREYSREELLALPIQSEKVLVRELVPASVMADVATSPPDPEHPFLSLKNFYLYFVWTKSGVKVRWKEYQGCCSAIHEGGDAIR